MFLSKGRRWFLSIIVMLNAYVGSCMAAVDPVYGSFMAVADLIAPVLKTNQTSDSLRTNDTLLI